MGLMIGRMGACWIVIIAACTVSFADKPGRPRNQSLEKYPSPPMQAKPWKPPETSVPKNLIPAARALFKAGFPDPRGCEFRRIIISTDGVSRLTTGWLLPGTSGGRHFAIGWDGLVYPAIPLTSANLADEVRAIIHWAEPGKKLRVAPYCYYHSIDLPKICFLLRLGQGKLAAELFKAMLKEGKHNAGISSPYFYTSGVRHWATQIQESMLRGHLGGYDDFAFRRGLELERLAKAFVSPEIQKIVPFSLESSKIFPYESYYRALFEDQQRRARQSRQSRQPARTVPFAPPDKTASLIRDLEDVSLSQDSFPGRVNWEYSEAVSSLIDCGRDAVEPLLACLAGDTRLTRSIHRWREYSTPTVLGVQEPALAALQAILGKKFYKPESTAETLPHHPMRKRKELAAEIRKHWESVKDAFPAPKPKQPERKAGDSGGWLLFPPITEADKSDAVKVLSDDQALAWKWVGAACVICCDVRFEHVLFPDLIWRDEVPKDDEFRGTRRKVVGDLLRKRIGELLSSKGAEVARARQSCRLAHYLGLWAPGGETARLLTRVMSRCKSLHNPNKGTDLGIEIAAMTLHRAKLKDLAVFDEYAAWLRKISRGASREGYPLSLLQPVWRHQSHPAFKRVVAWLFNDEKSSWAVLKDIKAESVPKEGRPDELVGVSDDKSCWLLSGAWYPQLIGTEGYRRFVLKVLRCKTKINWVTIHDDKTFTSPGRDPSGNDRSANPIQDPKASSPGIVHIRACDWFAMLLDNVMGMPAFKLYWKQEHRDAAIGICIDRLTRYGWRYTRLSALIFPNEHDLSLINSESSTSPILDRPATAEDVKAGHAIFSLTGPGDRRIVPRGKLPMDVEWEEKSIEPGRKLPDSAYMLASREDSLIVGGGLFDPGGYTPPTQIWQIEEILRDGKWERFYGLAGHNLLGRIPAVQVSFYEYGWEEMSWGLDSKLICPDAPKPTRMFTDPPPLEIKPGQAARLVVKLRNRIGRDQKVPARLCRKVAGGRSVFHNGVAIRIWRLDAQTAEALADCGWTDYEDEGNWDELPIKPHKTYKPESSEMRLLKPTASIEAMTFNLGDMVGGSKPGVYRVRVIFSEKDGGFVRGYSNAVDIHVTDNSGRGR